MLIKYMGMSDERAVYKGDDFDGQLATPLNRDLSWNWGNKHVIDTADYDGVTDEFWTLLLEGDDFKDVSGMERIPTNLAQQTWKAMPKTQAAPVAEGEVSEASEQPAPSTSTGGSTKTSRRGG